MSTRAERVRLSASKEAVRQFWDEGPCGSVYASGAEEAERFEAHRRARYALEPYILDFARFREGAGRDVLEIGVGLGADHVEWARSRPRNLQGVDLTPAAIEATRSRLAAAGLASDLRVADAERLPFADDSFDLVYSWGVLHHSPDTLACLDEVFRVLRPGGTARIMVYHRASVVGAMLWLRYALLNGHPGRTLEEIYARHLESPGTKAYTVREAELLCWGFAELSTRILLSFGDLLQGEVGQRHRGPLLTVARALWPRRLLRRLDGRIGLYLLIEARKPTDVRGARVAFRPGVAPAPTLRARSAEPGCPPIGDPA